MQDEVTNGTVDPAHYGPLGDMARHIASYCEGTARVHVYTAAFNALAKFEQSIRHQANEDEKKWARIANDAVTRGLSLERELAETRQQAERDTLARMGWRDIESAPKDGTPLLLFARSIRAIAPVRVIGWYIEGRGWLECAFSPNTPIGLVPSAWQQLPDMPARFDEALPPAPEAGQ